MPVEDRAPIGVPARPDPRRVLGTLGEDLAIGHFRRLGFVLIDRNVRTRHGEIDLIACDDGVLVFVEVKTRRAAGSRRGLCPREQPLAWLGVAQRERLRRLACAWLYESRSARPKAETIRFDAVGVVVDGNNRLLRLDHIEGAW